METPVVYVFAYLTTKYTKITKRIDHLIYLPLRVLRALRGYIWIN